MAFALLVDLSVGLEWRPTEPTHMLSNIYKCHRAKAFHTSIFCEDPSYNESVIETLSGDRNLFMCILLFYKINLAVIKMNLN